MNSVKGGSDLDINWPLCNFQTKNRLMKIHLTNFMIHQSILFIIGLFIWDTIKFEILSILSEIRVISEKV